MGAGVVLMLLGVVALVLLMPKRGPAVPHDPERAVIWLHTEDKQWNVMVVLVESRSRATLTAIPLPGALRIEGRDVDPAATFQARSPVAAHRALEEALGRRIHRRVFLPTGVISQLIDAAGGIDVAGARLGGAEALQWLAQANDGQEQVERATVAFLALLDAVNVRGINMGVREGLALARAVETNMELTNMPAVFERWSAYGAPRIVSVFRPDGTVDPGALEAALLEDPAASPR